MRVLVPYLLTDQTAAFAGAAQSFLCFVHTVIRQIFNETHPCLLTEDHAQMIR